MAHVASLVLSALPALTSVSPSTAPFVALWPFDRPSQMPFDRPSLFVVDVVVAAAFLARNFSDEPTKRADVCIAKPYGEVASLWVTLTRRALGLLRTSAWDACGAGACANRGVLETHDDMAVAARERCHRAPTCNGAHGVAACGIMHACGARRMYVD